MRRKSALQFNPRPLMSCNPSLLKDMALYLGYGLNIKIYILPAILSNYFQFGGGISFNTSTNNSGSRTNASTQADLLPYHYSLEL